MENNAFLGKGWAFPPAFQEGGKSVSIVQGEEDIEQSLIILFSTRFNERVLHHQFGTSFDDFVFEDIGQNMVVNMKKMVSDAVDKYEPRISLESVNVFTQDLAEGSLHVEVTFRIKGTNTRHNLVFPFNLGEGSLYPQIVGS